MMFRNFLMGSLLLLTWANSAVLVPLQSTPPSAPPNSSAMLSDALTLYRQGSFDQAIAKYNDVLKGDPHSGAAYAGIMRCYLKKDKIHEADDTLQKALQTDPGNADLKVAEGELLFRQGEIPEAGKVFDEVLSTPPDPVHPNTPPNARAYFGAARVAAASAMYARQQVLLRRARALDAADPDIQKMWLETLATDDRIRELEEYLTHPNGDDEATRRRLFERLDFLKASRTAKAGHCRPSADVTSMKTNLVPISLSSTNASDGTGLDVQINGKPARLLLDTGASGILLNLKMAASAGLKPAADVRMGGIGDLPDQTARAAWADSVRVGEIEFQNCPVYIVDRMPAHADGIIGADVFANFLIEIDFTISSFQLRQLPPRPDDAPTQEARTGGGADMDPDSRAFEATTRWRARYQDRDIAPAMQSYVQAFRIGHNLLIPTTVNEKEQKLFILDTGAFDNTISTAAAQEVTKIHRAPLIDVKGMNGSVKKAYVADRVTLDFGHLRQTVPNIVAVDEAKTSRMVGTEISGTLGMVMLHLLKIRLDYRDALVDFQYAAPPPRKR
jgi:Tfp pilus assembly protein PilF/predicted aspartyl protease